MKPGVRFSFRWMLGRLFDALALLSLLLALGVAATWVRSHFAVIPCDCPFFYNVKFCAMSGEMQVTWYHPDPTFMARDHIQPSMEKSILIGRWRMTWSDTPYNSGFKPAAVYPVGTVMERMLAIHDWFLLAVCSVLPAWWIKRRWRRQPRAGHCQKCGYDLRASKNACPECGEAIAIDQAMQGVGSSQAR
ncbi:MAG: hypothetical protein NTW19_02940 [Planctomycetota bacterium]|nr:hypothetical protein [Planctomycetota bacterium]